MNRMKSRGHRIQPERRSDPATPRWLPSPYAAASGSGASGELSRANQERRCGPTPRVWSIRWPAADRFVPLLHRFDNGTQVVVQPFDEARSTPPNKRCSVWFFVAIPGRPAQAFRGETDQDLPAVAGPIPAAPPRCSSRLIRLVIAPDVTWASRISSPALRRFRAPASGTGGPRSPRIVDPGRGQVLSHGPLQEQGPPSQPHGQPLGSDVQSRILGPPERHDVVDVVERMSVTVTVVPSTLRHLTVR